jgi:hypothetical protein
MNPIKITIDKEKLKKVLENPTDIDNRKYLEYFYKNTQYLSYEQILEVSNCNGCRNEIG